MATKYGECLLAVKYRETDSNGQMIGGPMYYLEKGVGSKLLAKLFAILLLVLPASVLVLPAGQRDCRCCLPVVEAPRELTVIILTVLVATVTLGGIKSIASVASKVVPIMAGFYIWPVSPC